MKFICLVKLFSKYCYQLNTSSPVSVVFIFPTLSSGIIMFNIAVKHAITMPEPPNINFIPLKMFHCCGHRG